MIRLQICGDFGVSQKLFDIAPRNRQVEQAFSISFFGGFDVPLLRFYFPLHSGGNGSVVHVPGRTLGAAQRDDHQQPGVLEMGSNLQGPDDHHGGN